MYLYNKEVNFIADDNKFQVIIDDKIFIGKGENFFKYILYDSICLSKKKVIDYLKLKKKTLSKINNKYIFIIWELDNEDTDIIIKIPLNQFNVINS